MSVVEDADLHRFVNGDLDEARLRHLLEQLREDPTLLERLARYQEQRIRLQAEMDDCLGPEPTQVAELRQALAGRLARRSPTASRWVVFGGMAASLLLAGWIGGYVHHAYFSMSVPDMVEDVATGHMIFAGDRERPVEIPASDRTEIAAWFSEMMGEQIEVPVLNPAGLTLVGGRMLATEEGPLGQLIYEDALGRRLTLALSVQDIAEGPEIRLAEVHGYAAGYWQEGDLGYALIADTQPENLIEVAMLIGAEEPDD